MNLYVMRYGSSVIGVSAVHYMQATTVARNALAEHYHISPSLVGVLDEAKSAECRQQLSEVVRLRSIEDDPIQLQQTREAASDLRWHYAELLRLNTHPEAVPYLWLNYMCPVSDDHPVAVMFASIY